MKKSSIVLFNLTSIFLWIASGSLSATTVKLNLSKISCFACGLRHNVINGGLMPFSMISSEMAILVRFSSYLYNFNDLVKVYNSNQAQVYSCLQQELYQEWCYEPHFYPGDIPGLLFQSRIFISKTYGVLVDWLWIDFHSWGCNRFYHPWYLGL